MMITTLGCCQIFFIHEKNKGIKYQNRLKTTVLPRSIITGVSDDLFLKTRTIPIRGIYKKNIVAQKQASFKENELCKVPLTHFFLLDCVAFF
jgi:hypothetical protein